MNVNPTIYNVNKSHILVFVNQTVAAKQKVGTHSSIYVNINCVACNSKLVCDWVSLLI